jgi:tetratricopeptide (TPR) repeat protein
MDAVLAVDPQHLPTLDARSFMLSAAGRIREGSQSRLAYAHRELLHAGIQFRLVYAYWLLGRLPEADRTADRALQLWPTHPGVWSARLWTLAFTGRAERALSHVQDVSRRPAAPPVYYEMLEAAMRALEGGGAREASRATRLLLAQVSQNPTASVNAVMILNGLGEPDRALDVAEAYLLERGPIIASVRWRPGQPSVNDQRRRKTTMLFLPVSAPMREDPRFRQLTEDVGLAAYWEKAGVTPDHEV